MANPYGAPEISVQEVAQKRTAGDEFIWLDDREPEEFLAASINDETVIRLPLSEIASRQLEALPDAAQDKEAEIIVTCHHGARSAQVVMWLQQQGWTNVLNMDGGIDTWAREVDPEVGVY